MTATNDQQLVEKHLQDSVFCLGQIQEKWRLINKSWPDIVFEVKASCGKWWCLKINLEGYPVQAPKGLFWSQEENRSLQSDKLPRGGALDGFDDGIERSFKNHEDNLYCPFDRAGLKMHPEWATKHPKQAWSETKTITFYLENIYALLNSRGYRPAENAEASNTNE